MAFPVKHLSVSSVNTFLNCPEQWRRRYVLKERQPFIMALTFGSIFHKIVEMVLKGEVEVEGDMGDLWDRQWQGEMVKAGFSGKAWSDEVQHNYDIGRSMIIAEDTNELLDTMEAAKDAKGNYIVEQYLSFPMEGLPVPVVGYVDFLGSDGVPGDIKTSSKRWSQAKADKELQATVYISGLRASGYDVGNTFRYYVFVKADPVTVQVIETKRSEAQIADMEATFRRVANLILNGEYVLNTRSWLCNPRWCDYWKTCDGGAKRLSSQLWKSN